MTQPPESDPPLSPEQEAAVRRALAAAGGPEPMPDDVAGRLDQVIAGLAAERGSSSPGSEGGVVPLDAAARRRRTRARVLVGACAAAAVVALSLGVLNDRAGEEDVSAERSAQAPTRSASASASEEAGVLRAPTPEADAPEDQSQPGLLGSPPERVETSGQVRPVRASHLREDLMALQRAALPAGVDYGRTTLAAPATFMCEDAAYGRGYLVGVEYAGKPALVAFREPAGSTQVAEVLACGTGEPLHSTTLDAR